tara:strand:- start:4310 stop:7627 length:3318 start_codon:yes stop_codon:yes gene_type:complete
MECDWKDVKKSEDHGNTAIKIMAYDIEADSSHGDFPLPIKDYTKFARELYNSYYKFKKELQDNSINDHHRSLLSDKVAFCYECLIKAFTTGSEELDINKIFIKKGYRVSKTVLRELSTRVAELLIISTTKNSIELKRHNMNQIEKINNILNNNLTFDEVKRLISDISGEDEITNWKYRDITSHFPPYKGFVSKGDIAKLIDHYDDGEIGSELSSPLPPIKGDQTIQIGMSFIKYGSQVPYKNYMLTLRDCDTLHDAQTECYDSEAELLLRFTEIIQQENPEIISGWNTDGFDTPWLFKRAAELNIMDTFGKMSKLTEFDSSLKRKQKKGHTGELVSVDYVDIVGRIQLDLLPLVRKAYNLNSYKLDNVSAEFIKGNITSKTYNEQVDETTIYSKNVSGINERNFVNFKIQDGYLDNKYNDGQKFEIFEIDTTTHSFKVNGRVDLDMDKVCSWCLGKDDVSPKDIFRLQNGSSADRYIIAKYCMMDVILCIELLNKLELLTNNIGMANVCKNPLSWIIHRGQGIKILSLVAYYLKDKNYLLPFLYKDSFDREGYEGAVVLDPNPGIYIDRPIAVLDYSSLYPSSMIECNLSHETIIHESATKYLGDAGGALLNKKGYDFEDITYDRYKTIYTPSGLVKAKLKVGEKVVRYVQYRDGTKGIIPNILNHLLSARKNARKKIKYKTITTEGATYSGVYNSTTHTITLENNEIVDIIPESIQTITDSYSDFEKKILDGLQLAFKVTANSLYGQLGAKTSDIYYKEIAASTTAVGRDRLLIARDFAIDSANYPQTLNNGEVIYLKNKITYGDTDSIFVEFECIDGERTVLVGREARKRSIELAVQTEKQMAKILKKPQYLEYEKTFDPFILLSKKRYVGNLYEHDPDSYKRKCMGIVLKRRDNSPIVKVIYGGIIDIIMKEKSIYPAITYLRKTLRELVKGKFGMETLVVTKTLASYYKDPNRIAHKVLADRMGDRDPGNRPEINDRIPYIYIYHKKKQALQGDRIEHPKYIRDHDLKPDYEFYITNQIMKPVSQIFALCLKDLPGFTGNISEFDNKYHVYKNKGKSENDSLKYMLECKRKEAAKILFRDILRILKNKRENNTLITDFFNK